jgi:hypothetical protein
VEPVEWRVCSEAWVNVLLEMPSLGIGLHGHDVRVRFCGTWRREGLLVYDIDALSAALREALGGLERRRLSKKLGREAALEDLALHVCREVSARLNPKPVEASVEVGVPNGSVAVRCRPAPGEPLD